MTHQIQRYLDFLRDTRGLQFTNYDALWRWSVTDLHAFWQSVWDFFDVQSPTPHATVLADEAMPGARWFPGTTVNFARQVLRHADAMHERGCPAIVFADEAMLARGELQHMSWPELRARVASCAAALRRLGMEPGDRVAAYLPNRPEAVVAFLACASVGAVWSLCSPDMGPAAVLDRWRQIEPKLLIACDGNVFAGVAHDRRAVVDQLVAGLPSLAHVVRGDAAFAALCADGDADAGIEPAWLPFDHPLWIVYSSGTTGLPKPIVHGHGGIVVEQLKLMALHNDVHAGDRFHWYSSTGWIMWNCQVAALLLGATACLFDGSPGGPSGAADWTTLWRWAGLARLHFLGAGAAFHAACLKADVRPMEVADLSSLRAVGSTGSPLSEDAYRWLWQRLPKQGGRDIWIAAISGGTDFAGAFIGGLPTLPVTAGEMQVRCLGAAVESWREDGVPLIDEVGELVCTKPMPSMPLYFWGDADGRRYVDSYFDTFPGVWRHGDWLRIVPHPDTGAAGAVIYGRSDATINRHGIRMGTAELYRAVEALPEVLDSLVVDLEYLGRPSWMPLFVVLREGVVLDAALEQRMRQAIRAALSAHHVPNEVLQVDAVPRTLSGKKMELPVKKLLLGAAPEQVLAPDAMANPQCVAWYVDYARRRTAHEASP